MHIANEVSLSEFYERYRAHVAASGFKVLILALVREADAPEFYSDILRYWDSLNDLTGSRIIFAVAGPRSASSAGRHQYVGDVESPLFTGSPESTPHYDRELYEIMKDVRARDNFKPQSQRPTEQTKFGATNTAQISDLRDQLQLREDQLPCLHLSLLSDTAPAPIVLEIRSFSRFSIYTVCKDIVVALNDELRGFRPVEAAAKWEMEKLDAKLALVNDKIGRATSPQPNEPEKLIVALRSAIVALDTIDRDQIEAIISFCEGNALHFDKKTQAFAQLDELKRSGRVSRDFLSEVQRLIDVAFGERYQPRDTKAASEIVELFVEERNEIRAEIDEAGIRRQRAIADVQAKLDTKFSTLRKVVEAPSFHERQWDFFISYASQDRELAQSLFHALDGSSRAFMDQFSLKPGEEWVREIPDAQSRCSATIPIITSNTRGAHYQVSEIERAVNLYRTSGHKVLPVYADASIERPFGLEQFHSLFLSEQNVASIASTLKERQR